MYGHRSSSSRDSLFLHENNLLFSVDPSIEQQDKRNKLLENGVGCKPPRILRLLEKNKLESW